MVTWDITTWRSFLLMHRLIAKDVLRLLVRNHYSTEKLKNKPTS